jgi:hypothetical protein
MSAPHIDLSLELTLPFVDKMVQNCWSVISHYIPLYLYILLYEVYWVEGYVTNEPC